MGLHRARRWKLRADSSAPAGDSAPCITGRRTGRAGTARLILDAVAAPRQPLPGNMQLIVYSQYMDKRQALKFPSRSLPRLGRIRLSSSRRATGRCARSLFIPMPPPASGNPKLDGPRAYARACGDHCLMITLLHENPFAISPPSSLGGPDQRPCSCYLSDQRPHRAGCRSNAIPDSRTCRNSSRAVRI